eukprot:195827-Pelagomonas_calceolata.AAC.1
MGMKFASEVIGALVVKFQLFKLVKGVLSTAGPSNTQKDGVKSHNFCINVCRGLHAAAVPPPTAVQSLCLHST